MTGKALFAGFRTKRAFFSVQVLHGEFVVHDRHDDVADVGVGLLLDHDQVAVVDAGVDHRFALHAHQARLRRHPDEVVVDRDQVVAVGERRVGQPRLHGVVRETPLEEPGPGLQLPVRSPVQVARFLEAAHALRHPRLGRDPPQGGEHRVRRDHLVLGVVVLELLQVRRVEGLVVLQRHGRANGGQNDCSVSYRTIVLVSSGGCQTPSGAPSTARSDDASPQPAPPAP